MGLLLRALARSMNGCACGFFSHRGGNQKFFVGAQMVSDPGAMYLEATAHNRCGLPGVHGSRLAVSG
jgi:hypothetical protein